MSGNTSTIKEQPIAFRILLHKELIDHGILPSCLNCEHSNTDGKMTVWSPPKPTDPERVGCNLYKQFPPLSVVVVGCENYRQAVPF